MTLPVCNKVQCVQEHEPGCLGHIVGCYRVDCLLPPTVRTNRSIYKLLDCPDLVFSIYILFSKVCSSSFTFRHFKGAIL